MVEVALGPSGGLSGLIAAAHGGGAAALLASRLEPWPTGLLLLVLAFSAAYHIAVSGWRRAPWAIQRLRVGLDGRCALDRGRGWEDADLASRAFVSPWLVLAFARPSGTRLPRTLAIAADAADPEDFRRLRVILRWMPEAAA